MPLDYVLLSLQEKEMIKKIAILTSGGDCPGMNNAIRAAARFALRKGVKVALVHNGFKGLVANQIVEAQSKTFSKILATGGTFIGSARLPEFKEARVRAIAIANLAKHQIDGLIVIGGDGSFMGALRLTQEGVNCIGIPGTIDNDIAATDYSIGFDTSLNTIIDAVDKIRDTTFSHGRCNLIEVMGRDCGDLALYASLATGAEVTAIKEFKLSEQEIIAKIKAAKAMGKTNAIAIIAEKQYDVHSLAEKVSQETGFITRATVLGHIQRGGKPSAFDRVLASQMGIAAAALLIANHGGKCVGIKNNQIMNLPIGEAIALKRPKKTILFEYNEAII